MAITPFTQPVEDTVPFVPDQAPLPVEQIGETATSIYQQDVKQRDRLSKIRDRLSQQKASNFDQEALRQMENRYRQRIQDVADDELLFGDRQTISDLARDFASEAQILEQNKKNIQEQLEAIDELENPSEARKQEMKQTYLQNAGLSTTEEGRIDPESVFSPTSVGEEPESIQKRAREKIQELPETFLGESVTRDPQTGKLKVTEASGVTGQRIANLLMGREVGDQEGISDLVGEDGKYEGALTEDPEVQNWMKQKRETLLASGYSEEQANKAINNRLQNAVASMVDNFSYRDVDTSRITRADGDEEGGDTMPAIASPAPMQSMSEAKGSERKELKSHKEYLSRKALQDMFSGTDLNSEDIRDIEDTIRNPQNRIKYRGQGKQGNIEVKESKRQAALREIENKYGSDIADRVRREYDQTLNRMESDPSMSRRKFITPPKDVRLNEVRRAFRNLSGDMFSSEDINRIEGSNWEFPWPGASKSFREQLKNQVINYGNLVGMTKDGTMRFRMPNSENVDSDMQGKAVDVRVNDQSKNSLMQAYANVVDKSDPWTAEAMKKELEYDNIPVKTKESGWDEVNINGQKGKARYNPTIGGFQVATNDEDPVSFSDVIKAEGEINNEMISGFMSKIPKFQRQGIDVSEINTYNELRNALKAATGNGEFKNEAQRMAIEQVINEAVPFEHKGMALDYLNKIDSE